MSSGSKDFRPGERLHVHEPSPFGDAISERDAIRLELMKAGLLPNASAEGGGDGGPYDGFPGEPLLGFSVPCRRYAPFDQLEIEDEIRRVSAALAVAPRSSSFLELENRLKAAGVCDAHARSPAIAAFMRRRWETETLTTPEIAACERRRDARAHAAYARVLRGDYPDHRDLRDVTAADPESPLLVDNAWNRRVYREIVAYMALEIPNARVVKQLLDAVRQLRPLTARAKQANQVRSVLLHDRHRGRKRSDREIARQCGVSPTTVGLLARKLDGLDRMVEPK